MDLFLILVTFIIKYLYYSSSSSTQEFHALKNLSRLKKEIIIQKSDKGNSVVLVNKSDYVRHIEGILKDVNKFEKVSLKKGILNFAVNHEQHINKQLRSISKNGSLTEQQYKKVKLWEAIQVFYMTYAKYIRP